MTHPATALVFPGQGSQHLSMGRTLGTAFAEAARVFEEADDILGFGLSRIMWEGPEEVLVLTQNAQPAILTHSVAVLRSVQLQVGPDALGTIVAAAGHSLGEFSAHVAAGTLGFRDALTAVRLRGELMAAAGRSRRGSMAAVLGADDASVASLCEAATDSPDSIVVPANYNAPGQVVVSGDVAAVDRATEIASDHGARKVVPLSVSGAFHSPLMAPAEEGLRACLGAMNFERSRYPVYSNVTASPVDDPDLARDLLLKQLTSPVRWAETVSTLVRSGVTRFIEVGPGSVLRGLNRKTARAIETLCLGEPEHLDSLR